MAQDIQLKEFHKKVIRKRTLSKEVSALQLRQQELFLKTRELENKKLAQQKDVDRLERNIIRKSFYTIFGKYNVKLEKEREEAIEAARQYEEVCLELQSVRSSIELKETELTALEGYEEKFNKMLEGKRRLLENSSSGSEVIKAENELKNVRVQYEELATIIGLGEQIILKLKELQETLIGAENAENIRRFSGTVLLDKSQKQAGKLQKEIQDFGERIEDILKGEEIKDNLNVVYQFCNGIYTSYVVGSAMQVALLERIRTARGNAKLLEKHMEEIMRKLYDVRETQEESLQSLGENIEYLIINV